MDTDALLESIREDNRTALSRLGSSKALYALTEGEMEPGAVRAAAVTLADDAAETFESWDGDVFAAAAEAAREHREAVADGAAAGDAFTLTDALADADGEVDRLGAFVGWTLVAENVTGQCTGFFTGQADPTTASTFREYANTLADLREQALAALADYDDAETAAAAATAIVQAAYEEYVETLEGMGVNPKPVC